MIKIAGYGRMSTDKQQMSPEVQEKVIKDWIKVQDANGKWPDGYEFIGMFVDRAVTSKVHMLDREAGQHLMTALDPGDLIVVAKYDRAFRSAADAERTLTMIDELGLKIVFIDLNIDTSTPNGKMLAGILAVVSKHTRDTISDNTKVALDTRRKRGDPLGSPPPGWQIRRNHGKRRLIPDPVVRALGNATVKLVREKNYKYRQLEREMQLVSLKHGIKKCSVNTYLNYGACSMLGWPKIHLRIIKRLLEMDVGSIRFIKRDDHDRLRLELAQKMKEEGFEYEP